MSKKIEKIKQKIERELESFLKSSNRIHRLSCLSPLLYNMLKEFLLRKGKRIRPTLIVLSYSGFCKKPARNLYTTAISVELLHGFMLIHDDIIDKSDTRRGKPSMHKMLNSHINKYKGIKFSGEDLSIVIGDVLYALAIEAFLAIKTGPVKKEKALSKFIQAAMYTGSGEFIELLSGLKDISRITRKEIYNIYDYKTAYYTFACPLAAGAILGGATDKDADILSRFGILIGRAFQIKDDMLGILGDENKIGKSTLTDLQEAKRTLPIWYAYNKSRNRDKAKIKKILSKEKVKKSDLSSIADILNETKTPDFMAREINILFTQAQRLLQSSGMSPEYKKDLSAYLKTILKS